MEKVLDKVTQFRIFLVSLVVVLGAGAVVTFISGDANEIIAGLLLSALFGGMFFIACAWAVYVAKGPSREELMVRVNRGEQLPPAERLLLGFRIVPWGQIALFSVTGTGLSMLLWMLNYIITMLILTGTWTTGIGEKGGISGTEAAWNFVIYWLFAQSFVLTMYKRMSLQNENEIKFRFEEEGGETSQEVDVKNVEQNRTDEESVSLRVFKVISPELKAEEMVIGPFVKSEKLAKRLAARFACKIVKLGDDAYALEGGTLERKTRKTITEQIKEVAPDVVIKDNAA